MELELHRTHFTDYDTVLDTTVFQEETLESIVPDACPDIQRLIDTQGKILLKSKAVLDGRVTLTGTARLEVLYVPDGGSGLCSLEVNIPFSISVEEKNIRSGCFLSAVVTSAGADSRTLNPRKIVSRIEIAACVKVFSERTVALAEGIGASEGTVEQRTEAHQVYTVSAVVEKQVSFEDDLTIPTGRPAAEELLGSRVSLSCSDAKVIGNKLIFKGEASIQMLYRCVGGGLDMADFTLPFSQITEVVGVGENAVCNLQLCLTAADFRLREDGRTVSASLSMNAQAIIHEVRRLILLSDTYSTACQLSAVCAPFEYYVCRTEGVERQMVREMIETGFPLRTVVDSYCTVGRMVQSREGGKMRLTAQIIITVLCVTEEEGYCAVSRGIEVNGSAEVPEGCECLFDCRCENLAASPTADGVEARLSLNFPFTGLEKVSAAVVRDVSISDATTEEMERKPSIVLRVFQDGERLWDIAKRYGTTIADIIKANELASEQPDGGTLLLIPRKR